MIVMLRIQLDVRGKIQTKIRPTLAVREAMKRACESGLWAPSSAPSGDSRAAWPWQTQFSRFTGHVAAPNRAPRTHPGASPSPHRARPSQRLGMSLRATARVRTGRRGTLASTRCPEGSKRRGLLPSILRGPVGSVPGRCAAA